MKKVIITLSAICLFFLSCHSPTTRGKQGIPAQVTISKEVLMDKIKGGWAGQMIGVTYGGPTEGKFPGTMIQDYTPINWPDGIMKHYFTTWGGLYDDVYMDLTFVEVIERLGIDAPVDSFAMAFANARYPLWHANQAARHNILSGIMPPASGHWLNNPHADDIDYQIEADFAGLMSPGMPNSASEISDKIGHIMNYGDGWYGGVYVGAMYALAFISDDVTFVVNEALKTIPEKSAFYQCMRDVIHWHREFPKDWKRTWFECQKKWSIINCPEYMFGPYSLDAVINCAYVVMGLLYGEGDLFKTIDISTRCGQDSDCNPATAGGILCTMIGYSNISEYWMKPLREVEDMDFPFTNFTLNATYRMSFHHALQMIERGGGKVEGDKVTIVCQQPKPVRYEKSFEGHFPTKKVSIRKNLNPSSPSAEFELEGIGFVISGGVRSSAPTYEALVEVYVNGQMTETARLPVDFRTRRLDLTWKYQLPKGKHTVRLNWINPVQGASVNASEALIYSDAPVVPSHQ